MQSTQQMHRQHRQAHRTEQERNRQQNQSVLYRICNQHSSSQNGDDAACQPEQQRGTGNQADADPGKQIKNQGDGKQQNFEDQFHGQSLLFTFIIEIIEEITPRFKDRGLIFVLGKLVVDILELDGLGEIGFCDTADAIGHHALIWNTVLRRLLFFIRPVCSCDSRFDLLPFGAGQPLFCGQCGEPPCLVDAAAVTRRRNSLSCKDGTSGG